VRYDDTRRATLGKIDEGLLKPGHLVFDRGDRASAFTDEWTHL
jgi:hypothetical protein